MSYKIETIALHAGQEGPDPTTGAGPSRFIKQPLMFLRVPTMRPTCLP